MRFILMGRRLMFFWEILNKSDKEIVKNVVDIQMLLPEKYDWILLIRNDLNQCEIDLKYSEIKCYSKNIFKNLVKHKLRQITDRYLFSNKSSKLSGLSEIKMQDYLQTNLLTLKQKRLLYKFRIRMVDGIRDNFKSKFMNNMECPLCENHYDDQSSLLICPRILTNDKLKVEIEKIKYSNIFRSLELQVPTIKVLEKIVNFRNKLLT